MALRTRGDGPTATQLGLTRSDLSHLSALPHATAIAYAWERWSNEASGS
jgi:hypothetical protein